LPDNGPQDTGYRIRRSLVRIQPVSLEMKVDQPRRPSPLFARWRADGWGLSGQDGFESRPRADPSTALTGSLRFGYLVNTLGW